MEDPIRIDVWGQIRKGFTKEAVKFIMESRPLLSELEARKQVNLSVMQGKRISVFESVGWKKAQQLYSDSPEWLFNLLLLQEGYSPQELEPLSKYKNYCAIHNFYFGGCRGCQVCRGFIVG